MYHAVDGPLVVPSCEEVQSIPGIHHLCINVALEVCLTNLAVWTLTNALSMCFTHRHRPSFDRICRAATGWLHRMVINPKSIHPTLISYDLPSLGLTSVSFKPDIIGLSLFFSGAWITRMRNTSQFTLHNIRQEIPTIS